MASSFLIQLTGARNFLHQEVKQTDNAKNQIKTLLELNIETGVKALQKPYFVQDSGNKLNPASVEFAD